MNKCLVCGTGFDQDCVLCAACETAHHEDCFQYNRRCSTYACGSQKYKTAQYNDLGKFIGLETKDVAIKNLADLLRADAKPMDHATFFITNFLRHYTVFRTTLHNAHHIDAVDYATETLHITDVWTRAICRWAAIEWSRVGGYEWDTFFAGPEEKVKFPFIVNKYANELRKHLPQELL